MITPEIKYDYKDDNILKINFNFPAGIGSFSRDEEEIIKDFPELIDICKESNIEIINAIQLTEDINEAIYNILGDVNIDWRDINTVWIHNLNTIHVLIGNLENIAINFVKEI